MIAEVSPGDTTGRLAPLQLEQVAGGAFEEQAQRLEAVRIREYLDALFVFAGSTLDPGADRRPAHVERGSDLRLAYISEVHPLFDL